MVLGIFRKEARVVTEHDPYTLSTGRLVWRWAWFTMIALGGCTVDLLTKHWVFQWRGMPSPDNRWWLIEGYVGIEPALNPGALFGMGAGGGPFFAAVSVFAAVLILYLIFVRRMVVDPLLSLSLALILGGILGNLYDRLGLWHPPDAPGQWRTEVRDWILLCYKQYTWPNFNIADSLLVAGAACLFYHGWFGSSHKPSAQEPNKK
jgi:signal peptidase II